MGFLIVPAGFDEDYDVNEEDYLIWQNNFGLASEATWPDGDVDSDGDVDGNDFLIWQFSFGMGQQSHQSTAPVPEPTAVILMVVVLSVVSWSTMTCRRRLTTHRCLLHTHRYGA